MPTAVIVCCDNRFSSSRSPGHRETQSLFQVPKRCRDYFFERLLSSCFLELICPTGRIYDYRCDGMIIQSFEDRKWVFILKRSEDRLSNCCLCINIPEIASERECQTDSAASVLFRG